MISTLPLWPAWIATVALLVALALGSLSIPREDIMVDAPDNARWRDIRFWSVGLITIQLGLYWIFS